MFQLYKEQSSTFWFNDYALLMQEVKSSGAKTALEFGPGASTLALIEAGLEKIVTLEHKDDWLDKAKDKFKDYPQVTVAKYADQPVVTADISDSAKFDIAFVDSPKGFSGDFNGVTYARTRHPGMEDCSRLNTCLFALDHAPVVYLHDAHRGLERATLLRLHAMGHKVTFVGGFSMARINRHGNQNPS